MSGLGLVGCSRDTSISKHLFASRHKKQLLARNLQYLAYLGCCVKKERSTHCMHNDAAQCTTCLQENPEEKRKKNTHTHTHARARLLSHHTHAFRVCCRFSISTNKCQAIMSAELSSSVLHPSPAWTRWGWEAVPLSIIPRCLFWDTTTRGWGTCWWASCNRYPGKPLRPSGAFRFDSNVMMYILLLNIPIARRPFFCSFLSRSGFFSCFASLVFLWVLRCQDDAWVRVNDATTSLAVGEAHETDSPFSVTPRLFQTRRSRILLLDLR